MPAFTYTLVAMSDRSTSLIRRRSELRFSFECVTSLAMLDYRVAVIAHDLPLAVESWASFPYYEVAPAMGALIGPDTAAHVD